MIRLFIADDHPIFRHGIVQLLSEVDGFHVAGVASDGHATLDALGRAPADVLVLDLSLPRVSGLEVLRRVRSEWPQTKVVVLSMYPEEQYSNRLLREGASAYLSKHRPPEDLVDTIRRIVDSVPEPVAAATSAKGWAPHEELSAREHQIFMRLLEGRPVMDIAAELNLSQSTVSTHVAHIKSKLGVRSIAEIVSYGHRMGLMT